jgi:hypothetical protein
MIRSLFLLPEGYLPFVNTDNENQYYAVTIEEFERVVGKAGYYLEEDKAPHNITIKAYKIGKVGKRDNWTDLYDIEKDKFVNFSINKINHIGFRLGRS